MSRLILCHIRSFSSKSTKTALKTGEHIKEYNFENKALFGPLKSSKKTGTAQVPNVSKDNESEISSEMYWLLEHKAEYSANREKRKSTKKKRLTSSASVLDNTVNKSSTQAGEANIVGKESQAVEIPFSNEGLKSILKFPLVASEVQNYPETIENYASTLPSVGKILQATMSEASRKSLIAWKLQKITQLGEDGFKIMQEAQLMEGKMFHKSLEDFLSTGVVPDCNSDVYTLWQSVSPVLEQIQPKLQFAEKMIDHPFLKYRGVVDCVCSIGPETTVIEWKKSEKVKATIDSTFDAPLQLCAYLGALSADPNYKLEATKGYVIVANTDGKRAQVHALDNVLLHRYWRQWLLRLQEFWIRTRDGTLPEPI